MAAKGDGGRRNPVGYNDDSTHTHTHTAHCTLVHALGKRMEHAPASSGERRRRAGFFGFFFFFTRFSLLFSRVGATWAAAGPAGVWSTAVRQQRAGTTVVIRSVEEEEAAAAATWSSNI